MGLSFFETMAGTLVEPDGTNHLVDFSVKCEATSFRALARSGEARMTGIVRARPWAEDVPLDGRLRISFFRDRCIEYDLSFCNDAGQEFRLHGQKDLHWRNRLFGMTELHMELERDGETLAEGTLTFDLMDVPSFAASWQPRTTVDRVDLAGPAPGAPGDEKLPTPPVLDEKERALMAALARATIVPGEVVPPADEETVERAMTVLSCLPPMAQKAFRAGLKTLDAAARVTHGESFAALGTPEASALLDGIDEFGGENLTRVLGMPVEAGHFGKREYLDAFEVPSYDNPVREPAARWMSQVYTPDDLEPEASFPCDVVVIGTGAGGAPLAARLAERGFAVALVEEGRYYHRPQYAGSPIERLGRFWRDAGMNFAVGNSMLIVPTGKMVGGSTAINSGTSFDTPAEVLDQWRSMGFPADFEPDRFDAYMAQVRRELQVEKAKKPWLGGIADRIAEGAEKFRERGHDVEHGPLPRNAPGCDGQGLCSIGCPTGAKRSTDVSFVPRALKAGGFCFTGMSVKRILMRGNKAVAIEARGTDRHGARRTLRLEARAVVVACGTLESPLLLRENGFDLPRLGKGLSVHPALGSFALFDEDLDEPWRAIPQSYGVEGLVDETVRFEGFSAPPELTAPTLPLSGAELTRWMDNLPRIGQYGFMVRDPNDGSVHRGLHGRPMIRKSISPAVLDSFIRGSAVLAELMLLGGAEEVATGIAGIGTVRTIDEARAIADAPLKPRHFQSMGFHPLGTCAMGASPREGVVGFDNRVFGTQNVYVADGSSVPTSLGVNPQVTIMSMSLRAADILADRLS